LCSTFCFQEDDDLQCNISIQTTITVEIKLKNRWKITKKTVFKSRARKVFIYQKTLITISTITNEIDKIFMVNMAQKRNFSQKFLAVFGSMSIELLHSYNLNNGYKSNNEEKKTKTKAKKKDKKIH